MRNPNRIATQRRARDENKNDTLLIYNSSNGSTMQYAEWISKALQCDVIDYSRSKLGYAAMYQNIIFGGWIRSGEITRFQLLRQNIVNFGIENKNLFVFGVGIGDPTPRYVKQIKTINGCNFLPDERFYLFPGKFDPVKCKAADKITLKAMGPHLYDHFSENEIKVMKERFNNGYNGVDFQAVKPLISEIQSLRGE